MMALFILLILHLAFLIWKLSNSLKVNLKNFFNGVYKFNRSNNELELITDQIDLPNGIGISPDNKFIYVNKMGIIDSNPKVMKIDIETNELTTLFNGKDLSENHEGYFDGMIVHSSGNIFTSGPGGLLVISPVGKLMAKIFDISQMLHLMIMKIIFM